LTGVTYTQVPVCGYTFTSSYSQATSPSSSFVTLGTVLQPSVEIYSDAGANAGTVTVTFSNAITVDAGQGQTTTAISAPDFTFDIVVTNPCLTTVIDDPIFTPTSLTVTDG
jgi:hypothetical protein